MIHQIQNRLGWMTPENFKKWFGFIPENYLEIHVHSVLVRNVEKEMKGIYNPTFAPTHEKLQISPYYEVCLTLRNPSDVLMTKVMDEVLTMDAAKIMEFNNDLLPLGKLSRILYAAD